MAGEERTHMKAPVPVSGSGDGPGFGDECFAWMDLPMNKQGGCSSTSASRADISGYRYYACTLSPNQERGPTGPFYRTLPGPSNCPPVHISWLDRSSFLRISPDASTVTTDKGYRSGRANVAVREGTWYYEVVVERGDGRGGAGKGTGGEVGNAHVRVGWARREANLDAPVGADAYSYGVRDVGGEKVHISRPKPYGHGFRTGDVVGCLITLPPRPAIESEDEPGYVKRWRIPLRYKGGNYFEMDEYPVAKEMEALVNREGKAPPVVVEEHEPKKKVKKQGGDKAPAAKKAPVARHLATLPGSSILFFLNGEAMADSPAFEDLYDFLPLPPNEEHRYVGPRRGPISVERERESYQYHDDGSLGYFPMVSCFGRGKARVNFGPHWLKPPSLPAGTRPLAERWDDFRAEEVVYDERDEARLAERYREMMAAEARKPKPAVKAGTPGDSTPRRSAASQKRKKATPAPGETAEGTPASTPRMTPGVTPAPSSPAVKMDEDGEYGVARAEPDPPREESPRDAEGEDDPMDVNMNGEVKHEPGDDPNEGVSWA